MRCDMNRRPARWTFATALLGAGLAIAPPAAGQDVDPAGGAAVLTEHEVVARALRRHPALRAETAGRKSAEADVQAEEARNPWTLRSSATLSRTATPQIVAEESES